MKSFYSFSLRGLCIACLFLFAATAQSAVPSNWTDPGNYATDTWKGTGIQTDPYQISTAAELAKLAYERNYGSQSDYSGTYFELTADIDLNGHYWIPINSFAGNLDGAGHLIKNMIFDPSTRTIGLINTLNSNGVIRNLHVGSDLSIGIYGSNFPPIVWSIGSIVGINNGTISNCVNTGNITVSKSDQDFATVVIGGIAATNYSTIQNCYSTGKIEASGSYTISYIGGIAGAFNASSASISNCFSTSTINTSSVTGTVYSGGVLGQAYANSSITNSYFLQDASINTGLKGVGSGRTNGNPEPKTPDQFKAASFVATLNGNPSSGSWKADFSPNINNGYPILAWQNAQSGNWTDAGNYATTDWQGAGTQTSPYQISTAAELAKLAYGTNNSPYLNYSDTYFVLTADIDLSGHYWTPIGDFAGNLDGAGHSIKNMIFDPSTQTIGLINTLNSNGVIRNLHVGSDLSIGVYGGDYAPIYWYIGSIVGINSGTISNCVNTGNITVSESDNNFAIVKIGGIAATNNKTIQDCYSTGNIKGSGSIAGCYTGGIAGTLQASNASISNCFSTGSINTDNVSGAVTSGGVLGQAAEAGSITNSYFLQDATNNINTNLKGVGRVSYGVTFTDGSLPKTPDELKAASFVATLNGNPSSDSWQADVSPNINNGYPILKWQNTTITALPQTTVNTIKFYPNPARNYIELQGTTTLLPVKIFDMTGRMMISTQVKPGEKLNISALANGYYTINIDGQSLKMLKN